jgi:hypothetical protein
VAAWNPACWADLASLRGEQGQSWIVSGSIRFRNKLKRQGTNSAEPAPRARSTRSIPTLPAIEARFPPRALDKGMGMAGLEPCTPSQKTQKYILEEKKGAEGSRSPAAASCIQPRLAASDEPIFRPWFPTRGPTRAAQSFCPPLLLGV